MGPNFRAWGTVKDKLYGRTEKKGMRIKDEKGDCGVGEKKRNKTALSESLERWSEVD